MSLFAGTVVLFTLICVGVCVVGGPECRTYGQSCTDDYSCCGGCCLNNNCRDTYLDCRTFPKEDPCTNRYCPEDQVCYSHYPCTGCGLLVECRTFLIPTEIKFNKSFTHYHKLMASNHSAIPQNPLIPIVLLLLIATLNVFYLL